MHVYPRRAPIAERRICAEASNDGAAPLGFTGTATKAS